MNVNQYDIVLDVLVVNQTPDTLQGLSLELATLGDLKLVEKPLACTVGPHDFVNIKVRGISASNHTDFFPSTFKASIKVSSTENGIIFGNIGIEMCSVLWCYDALYILVYDIVGSTADRNCVVLNNIHIDIMDYIQPASCTETEFRKMWVEFEWENKITVNTNIKTLSGFLDHIVSTTNMKCLTPKQVGSWFAMT